MQRPVPIAAAAAPEALQQLRRLTGWSVAECAAALGLEGANAADRLRELERGARPPSGTVRQLLAYLLRDALAEPGQALPGAPGGARRPGLAGHAGDP
jgi:transcriptional regulator with XRE-family HTH domain